IYSHEYVYPTWRENPAPIVAAVQGYVQTDYSYPEALRRLREDRDAAIATLLGTLAPDDRAGRERVERAMELALRLMPLTPDHHFYIDQGANAHVRLVLIAIGTKLVAAGAIDASDDVIFLRYNELRVFMADPSGMDVRPLIADRRAEREKAYDFRPPAWIGTATESQLAFPYLTNWGFPEKFHRKPSDVAGQVAGIGGSPGVVEGIARVVLREDQFDDVRAGDILVCHMTNPAWVVLFTKIAGLVTNAGGTTAHPAVLSREFGIPAVVGTQDATGRIGTGDRVRVDGSNGTVDILEAAAQPRNDLFTP
ncbi:MAG: PEP-utilizing enzyme, partial [Candidatus Limnocylindria bacterium]